ncbi:MAG: copD [Alphaproteobacteria bacterium]|nr:copD [Alphaproteobacteria bacterium]
MNLAVILTLARGVYFAAVMLLFGGAVFRTLLKARLKLDATSPLRWIALVVALLSGCLWLVLAAAAMAGALDRSVLAQTLTGTLFGQVFVLRLAALLGLLLVPDGWIAAALAGLALALPAITGHVAQSSPAGFIAIGATLDAVHLLAAGLWIGGLAVLLTVRRQLQFAAALALFSEWAMVAVLLLVMTGMINAALVLLGGKGTDAPLYVYVLCAKLALVLAMLALAVVNRFRLLPGSATGAIARNAVIELALGGIVIALAGWLGQLPPTL